MAPPDTTTTDRLRREYRVPALEKGLDILEYLSEVTVPQSQADLSRALERSTSELFRMLMCLEQRGYILRDESSNKYSLSLRLFEMAHIHRPDDQLLRAAQATMRAVAHELRESCHIGTLHGDRLLIVAQEDSPEPVRISVEIGRPFPAVRTASGKLLLAQLEPEELDRRFAESQVYRELPAAERTELHEAIEIARDAGYIVEDSGLVQGVRDISVLIGSRRTGVIATLAVPILITHGREFRQDEILSTLLEQADLVTSRLGLRP